MTVGKMVREPRWLVAIAVLSSAAMGCFGDNGDGLDPAPDRTTPGEYGCSNCPDTDVSNFELNAGSVTSTEFSGTVRRADGDGVFFVQGANGQRLAGTIPTDASNGAFTFTAPLFCGEQLVKCVWSNDAGEYVLVTRVITENCITPDIRATISWDELGDDFELHLIKPGGRINDQTNDTDCTWTTCVGSSPDWGVQGDTSDDPIKDVDDTNTYGPENIFLAKPESGVYHVMIEHWGAGSVEADGRLILNVAGRVHVVEITNLEPQRVWKAATITWPGGDVATSTEIFDCSGSWSSGCTAALP